MTTKDDLIAARPVATAFFPYMPDALIVDERTEQGWPNLEHVPPLSPIGVPTFRCRPEYFTDMGQRVHEYGHEIEKQLIRAGDTENALRTALWTRRGFPYTWQEVQSRADAGEWGPIGSQGWWSHLPVEVVAESISRAILGAPWAERHAWSYLQIDHDGELLWWQDRFRARGVEVPAMRTFTFPLPLTNGTATKVGAQALSLTEGQRAALRLISGQGRTYAVDIQRVGLVGVETTLPDARGWLVEDAAVPIGTSGRWRLNVMVRNDYGGEGWYEARIEDVTAAV